MTTKSGTHIAAIGLALVGLVAGCSPSGGGTSASAGGGEAAGLTGDPVKVMVIAPLDNPYFVQPLQKTAAAAAEKTINAAGGINGHPIQVTVCDDKFDPNKSTACAQQAVTDEMTAVAGTPYFGPQVVPVLAAAGIPVVSGLPFSEAEQTSSDAFCLTGGVTVEDYAAGAAIVKRGGIKEVTILGSPSAQGKFAADQYASGVKAAGGSIVKTVTMNPTVPDVSPYAGSASADAEGIGYVNAEALFSRFYDALSQRGYTGLVSAGLQQIAVTDAPHITGTAYVSGVYDPNAEDYNASMKAIDPEATPNEYAQAAWASIMVIAQALKGSPTVDAAGLTSALSSGKTINIGPSLPTLNFTFPGPLEASPRVVNSQVLDLEISNGEMTPLGGFYDPFASAG